MNSISNDLITQFVKITNDKNQSNNKDSLFYGTIIKRGDTMYVQLDGSEYLTPMTSTVNHRDGERVIVTIKDHTAIVSGNLTSPSASSKDLDETNQKITNLDSVVAEKVDTKDLSASNARINVLETGLIKANNAILEKADVTSLNALAATVTNLSVEKADISDLNASNARITILENTKITTEYIKANFADVDLSNIKTGVIKTAMIAESAIGTTQIADGSITDAKIVNLTANKINAGILSVERLEIRGTNNSIVYELNNITGALQSKNVDTLNGEILTQRTITADKIVSNAITANEISSKTITANEIVSGTITSEQLASGSVIASKINVNSLEAIVAKIGGFDIGPTYIANGTTTIAGVTNSVYVGTNGISCGTNFKVTNSGILNASEVDISGKIIAKNGTIGGWMIDTNELKLVLDEDSETISSFSPQELLLSTYNKTQDNSLFTSITPTGIYVKGTRESRVSFNLNADNGKMILGEMDIHFMSDIATSELKLSSQGLYITDDNYEMRLQLNRSSVGNLVLGYGQYEEGTHNTNIYGGSGIHFFLKNPSISWYPYYKKNDSINVVWHGAGYITSNGTCLNFSIPLSKPVIGVSSISVSVVDGVTVRQNGKYLYGSSKDSNTKSGTYVANLDSGGNSIHINATFSDITNVINNDSCGIYASLKLTFK